MTDLIDLTASTFANDDVYQNYAELLNNTIYGTDFEILYNERPHAKVAYLAIHGGGIEVGTSEVVQVISELTNQTYYEFNAKRTSNNGELHLTSINYDEPIARGIVARSNHTISVHGYSDDVKEATALGGTDEVLMQFMREELEKEGFIVEPAPIEIGGVNPINIANVNTRKKGVQLELSTKLRKSFFKNYDWSRANRSKPENRTENFHRYIQAISRAVSKAYILAPIRILEPKRAVRPDLQG